MKRPGGRALKQRVRDALGTGHEDRALERLAGLSPRILVSPLFGALHLMEPRVHWTAVRVMGEVCTRLAGEDMEAARVVLRRMMWNLNDESGGIGWGIPEAMGEILARHEGLAREFVNILASYSREDGNFLEHQPLQLGLLWGLVRLARARPDLLRAARPEPGPFLQAEAPALRGLAVHLAGLLGMEEARPALKSLVEDHGAIHDDLDGILPLGRVGDLAREALRVLDRQPSTLHPPGERRPVGSHKENEYG